MIFFALIVTALLGVGVYHLINDYDRHEAQTHYLSAEDLNIKEWERDGLIALIEPLRSGALLFDMSYPEVKRPCGTQACIGGWLAINHGIDVDGYMYGGHEMQNYSLSLYDLFFPRNGTRAYEASNAQGAQAIINFLEYGDPQWPDVMTGTV